MTGGLVGHRGEGPAFRGQAQSAAEAQRPALLSRIVSALLPSFPRLSLMRRLRLHFVLTCGAALVMVLALIIGIAEMSVYTSMIETADRILVMMADNEGHFPADPLAYEMYGDDISRETPYESRWFIVRIPAAGGEVSIDTAQTVTVDDAIAMEYADVASTSGSDFGFVSGFRFMRRREPSGDLYVFLDRRRQLESFRSGVSSLVVISGCGVVLVLAILAVASKEIIRPVVESHMKQRRFIADAGHDIKTPLSIISADTEVLAFAVGEDNEWVEDIRRQVRTLTGLTNDLVFLSQLEEDQRGASRIRLDLSELVDGQCDAFSAAARAAGHSIARDIQPGIVAMVDERMMRQLMGVLLDNAIKYSSDGAEISVSLAKRRRAAAIVVENAAPDGTLGHVDRWFDRFYQEDASRTHRNGGFGIGLSMAEAVAKAHGGRIQASVKDGTQLTMTVTLPL